MANNLPPMHPDFLRTYQEAGALVDAIKTQAGKCHLQLRLIHSTLDKDGLITDEIRGLYDAVTTSLKHIENNYPETSTGLFTALNTPTGGTTPYELLDDLERWAEKTRDDTILIDLADLATLLQEHIYELIGSVPVERRIFLRNLEPISTTLSEDIQKLTSRTFGQDVTHACQTQREVWRDIPHPNPMLETEITVRLEEETLPITIKMRGLLQADGLPATSPEAYAMAMGEVAQEPGFARIIEEAIERWLPNRSKSATSEAIEIDGMALTIHETLSGEFLLNLTFSDPEIQAEHGQSERIPALSHMLIGHRNQGAANAIRSGDYSAPPTAAYTTGVETMGIHGLPPEAAEQLSEQLPPSVGPYRN